MDQVIKWGPFLLKMELVAILVSGFLGYYLVKYYLKREREVKKEEILNVLGNTLLLGIGVWKLSLILFDPISVWNNPAVLLYFSGGYRGWILAILVVFVSLLYQSKKQNLPFWKFFQWIGLGFSTAFFVYHSIAIAASRIDTGFHNVQIILSLILIWWFFKKGTANHTFQGVVWFGLGQILAYFLKPAAWLGLSQNQLIYLVVALLGVLGLLLEKKEERKKGWFK